jgi:hypothetical protein
MTDGVRGVDTDTRAPERDERVEAVTPVAPVTPARTPAETRAVDEVVTPEPVRAPAPAAVPAPSEDRAVLEFAAAADLAVLQREPAASPPAPAPTPAPDAVTRRARPAPTRISTWPLGVVVALGGSAALIALGSFLPWAEADSARASFSESGIDRYGAITLLAACLAVLTMLLMQWSPRATAVVTGCGALALGVAVFQVLDISRKADDLLARAADVTSAGVGAGLWLTLGASGALFVAGLYALIASARSAGVRRS